MKNYVGAIALGCVLVGCGGGKGKPLTPEQKENWIQLNASAGRSQTAAQDASRGVGRNLRLTDTNFQDIGSPSPATSGSAAEMIQALQGGQCEFSDPQASGGSGGFGMNLTVTGASCPVTMRLMMAMNFDPSGSGSFDLDMAYKVNSAQYRGLNDVTAMTLAGGFAFAASQTSATAKGSIKGAIESQKLGVVPVRFTLDGHATQAGSKFTFQAVWTIRGEDVILTAEGTQSGLTYTLNTETLDADEFMAYLTQGGPVMIKAFQSRTGG